MSNANLELLILNVDANQFAISVNFLHSKERSFKMADSKSVPDPRTGKLLLLKF